MIQTRSRTGSGMGEAIAGMLLIAGTYGMARFGVGLFAPVLAASRPDLVPVLGWAAAAQFMSYSAAAAVAARLVDRRPRAGVVLAGITSTLGCLGVAAASDPLVFVLAVLVGGMGGGFASPALVPLIDAAANPESVQTAQSVVNAGTAAGVIGAGVIAFTVPAVGPAWVLMAFVCAASAGVLWYSVRGLTVGSGTVFVTDVPAASAEGADGRGGTPAPGSWRPLLLPGVAAAVVGAGSAAVWTFGPLLISGAGTVPADRVGWLWIALGLGGLLGTFTGKLVGHAGLRCGWLVCSAALALATAAVSVCLAAGSAWPAYFGMALFGAGYMGMSAVLILWARAVRPGGAGAGTSLLFVALATGQAAGSAGGGAAWGLLDPVLLTAAAAAVCAAGGLSVVAGVRRLRVPEQTG